MRSTTASLFLIVLFALSAIGRSGPPSSSSKRSRLSTTTIDYTVRPTVHSYLPSFDEYRSTSSRHVSCNSTQFKCDNGRQCIDRSALCNGVDDCEDGSDEGGKCEECQYENGGCEHQCRNTPTGAECLCFSGWRPTHDGISCEDEDECANGRGHCQHFCHNTQGGFTCSCAPGFILQSDGSTCQLEHFEAGQILFSVGHQVRNLPLNSWQHLAPKELPQSEVLCDVRSGAVEGLDTNNQNSHYYYTRHGGIYSNFEGEICLVQGLHEFGTNVAVDWTTGNLYFVNEDPGSLGLCRSDGRFCTLLFKREDDLGTPRGLALFPKFGLIFWTDWGEGAKIERANMDGTDRRVIVNTALAWPNAITIDYVHNLVYFADSQYNLIERVRLDGTHREVVVRSGVFHPFDMIVFDDHVFWTDWGLYGVMMASISNNSESRSLYHSQSEQPYGIGLLHPAYHQKDLPNPCSNSTCSHICALTTKEHSHGRVSAACLCPLNYEFRDGSESECVPVTNRTTTTGPHWCTDAFVSACENGKACENGGACKIDQNEYGTVVGVRCECQSGFIGDFCEVRLTSEEIASSRYGRPGSNAWLAALLIFMTFVLITCVCIALLCRYSRYNQKVHSLRWSPSVIFRKTVMAAKNARDSEQRQRIISIAEDGSKASLCKSESFANPVYEEVQVPVHSTYVALKRESSTVSHDSDADSGLEFNTSNGSP